MLALLIPGVGMGAGAGSAPLFSGTIPDITKNENTGTYSYDLSTYFVGATSYSISPAVETGWSFDTSTAEFVIDTDDVGVFGTYVVTGTNAVGSAASNAFSVTVVATQSSGGWEFLYTYELHLKRRREEELKRQELEEETERIEAKLDREIAQLLREQEAKDAKRADLERLKSLAKQNADIESARRYSERVAEALARAIEENSLKAAARLDKELKRALAEEQEFLRLATSLLLQ